MAKGLYFHCQIIAIVLVLRAHDLIARAYHGVPGECLKVVVSADVPKQAIGLNKIAPTTLHWYWYQTHPTCFIKSLAQFYCVVYSHLLLV